MARAITTGGTLHYMASPPSTTTLDADNSTGITQLTFVELADVEVIGDIANEHVIAEGTDLKSGVSEGFIEGLNYGPISLNLFYQTGGSGTPGETQTNLLGTTASSRWGPAGNVAWRLAEPAVTAGGGGRFRYFFGVFHSDAESQRSVGSGFLMRSGTIRRNSAIFDHTA